LRNDEQTQLCVIPIEMARVLSIDSTGLKIDDSDGWLQEKRAVGARLAGPESVSVDAKPT
jgi:hypothetical protein